MASRVLVAAMGAKWYGGRSEGDRKAGSDMAELAASHVKKLVLEDAEGMRISADSVPAATKAAAEFLRKLGLRASVIARGHGRKTIMEEDIAAARAQIWGS